MPLPAAADSDDSNWEELADWFVGAPLRIVCILIGASILSWIARRFIRRAAYQVVAPDPRLAQAGLRRIGMKRADELLGALVRDPRRHARAMSISTVLGSTVTVAIWVIALIMVLGELDVDLAPLLAGAGIAGVALGFGAQSLVKDCITGLFMIIEDQYGIGDVVDLGEARGSVEEISLRRTVLRGQDGTVWHVPNGEIQRVGNMSQLWSVAVVDVTVSYNSDLERVTALVHEAADAVAESDEFAPSVLEPPEVLGVEAFAIDGMTIRLLVKTVPGTQWALQRALRKAVKEKLDSAGIEMPYPQRPMWTRINPEEESK
jgi:small-conductance mechanosensitive channel